jgi:hypothetical protein
MGVLSNRGSSIPMSAMRDTDSAEVVIAGISSARMTSRRSFILVIARPG